MMEMLTDYQLWAALISLSALEIVLGVDNVVFIALLVQHLPRKEAQRARMIGLSLALFMRIALLLSIAWIMGLTEPLLKIFSLQLSGKDLLMFAGGMFLIYKATASMHEEMTHEQRKELKMSRKNFSVTVAQIIFIDFIFSFDSVITAVGITQNIPVIVAAMVIAMLVMIFSSGVVADFIRDYPTLKVLALAFILMIGVFLVAEGFGLHIPRGYVYFGMAFSLFVETLNIIARKKSKNG